MEYNISLYLDTRYKKKSNLYPVKLRVYSNIISKTKFYPADINLSQADFKSAWETLKPRTEHKPLRLQLEAIQTKANEVAADIKPFSFELFEKKMFKQKGNRADVFSYYQEIIEQLEFNKQLGTSISYKNSRQSIEDFLQFKYGSKKKTIALSFMDINPQWLQAYEKYMINTKERSRTTVSIYLRSLRAAYNTAIKNKEISAEYYPFGKNKYQPPSTRNIKKALSHEQLQQLFKVKPQNDYQQKARDFWFFSYSCNGMNIKDIALLRHENIEGDKIVFYRAKTINTTKKDIKPVAAYLTDFSKEVIKKYGSKSKNPKALIFDIIDDSLSDTDNHWKIKNFTRFINQHIKCLAQHYDISINISTYWARHSFATNAIRKGASMEFVSEALSHSDLKTTQNYFAGFEDSSKKELMDSLMDF